MTTRARQVRIVALVVAAQALVVASYLVVERQRGPHEDSEADPLTASPEAMDAPLPPLEFRRRDGQTLAFQVPGRHTLLHVWGTWCPPCRAELPGLLSLPSRHPVDVIAVALDATWAPVDYFLEGRTRAQVVLGDSARIQEALGVRTLPATFLVSPQGRLVARFDGARRWSDSAFCERWLTARGIRTPH